MLVRTDYQSALAGIFFYQLQIPVHTGLVEVHDGFVKKEEWDITEKGKNEFYPLLHTRGVLPDSLRLPDFQVEDVFYFFSIDAGEVRFEREMELYHFFQGKVLYDLQIRGNHGQFPEYQVVGNFLAT